MKVLTTWDQVRKTPDGLTVVCDQAKLTNGVEGTDPNEPRWTVEITGRRQLAQFWRKRDAVQYAVIVQALHIGSRQVPAKAARGPR